jgi:hypothetical protein
MKPIKLIISAKEQLRFKYGSLLPKLEALLKKMKEADAKKGLDTRVVFLDVQSSLRRTGVKKIKVLSEEECKRAIDELYKFFVPAYIVILGWDDVIPFQLLDNPAIDQDVRIPSDLPYACDAPFSEKIDHFTGPTRVVGRIPDLPGKQKNIDYLKIVLTNSMKHKPMDPDQYREYFSLASWDFRFSTEISLQNMFGHNGHLITAPGAKYPKEFTRNHLKPLTHFFNCHGAARDLTFYGQKGKKYPKAFTSTAIQGKITPGTIVVAQCCFGAQLFDPFSLQPPNHSFASAYLSNDAIAYLGSSNISYGPTDSQSLSDLITQYFVKNVLKGASIGRAFLEARQSFLTDSGPDLDPYELKTLAQFYLLGDPSVQPAECEQAEVVKFTVGNAIMNSRKNLFIKGTSLSNSISNSSRQKEDSPIKDTKQLSNILKKNKLVKADKKSVYRVASKGFDGSLLSKKLGAQGTKFHTFVRQNIYTDPTSNIQIFSHRVLVVKENNNQILGWRAYQSK